MSRGHTLTTTGAIMFAAAAVAAAGPAAHATDYCEMGDAGNDPMGAQSATGSGSLSRINGTLQGPGVAGDDFEDMYLIVISDPVSFTAMTFDEGSGEFDTQLWLFQVRPGEPDLDGLGLLGNDDTINLPPDTGNSRLIRQSTDGTPIIITEPGLYYIAISGKGDNPISAGGAEIFDIVDPFEVSGPDGPGGSMPITAWTQTATGQGAYSIAFTGVSFVPPPKAIPTVGEWGLVIMSVLFVAAAAVVLRRRRAPCSPAA